MGFLKKLRESVGSVVYDDFGDKELNLSNAGYRNVKYFPDEFNIVDLSDNSIRRIPEWFMKLKNLYYLDLRNNNIEVIENLPLNLEYLYVSGNNIKYIDERSLEIIEKNDTFVDIDVNNLKVI